MATKPPDTHSDSLQESEELCLREWGEEIILADKSVVGGWLKADESVFVDVER